MTDKSTFRDYGGLCIVTLPETATISICGAATQFIYPGLSKVIRRVIYSSLAPFSLFTLPHSRLTQLYVYQGILVGRQHRGFLSAMFNYANHLLQWSRTLGQRFFLRFGLYAASCFTMHMNTNAVIDIVRHTKSA